MIYILNTKECLCHHHCYTMYDKFTLQNTKNVNLCLNQRLHVSIYVYLCLLLFIIIYGFFYLSFVFF